MTELLRYHVVKQTIMRFQQKNIIILAKIEIGNGDMKKKTLNESASVGSFV